MAIAYNNSRMDADASTNILVSTSSNFQITGSNITLIVFAFGQAGSSTFPTAVKWGGSGGISMTSASANIWVSGGAIST